MQIRPLSISGAWVVEPQSFSDDRGEFWEWYRFDTLADQIGHPFELRQANASLSRAGVLRGVHFADVPPGQAKYVTVAAGAVIDFIVDIRAGSPTFGRSEAVRLDTENRRAVYIAEGLGHAFVSLADGTVVTYLVSDVYRPEREHAVTPLDPALGLDLPFARDELILSPKDAAAPTLQEALDSGLLPVFEPIEPTP